MMNYTFISKDSLYHKLNPLCKIVWSMAVVIAALVFNNPVYLTLLFLATAVIAVYARVFREWISYMKYGIWFGILIMLINPLFSYHGTHIIYEFPFKIPVMGSLRITLEALAYGGGMALRLLTIISAFATLTYTVNPDDMLNSLTRIRPFYRSVYVTSLAARFMPTLVQDSNMITEIQKTRGLDIDSGNLIKKIRNRIPIVIPLLSNSLDRAIQVSEAMESRAFGCSKKRTFYKDSILSKVEFIIITLTISSVLMVAYIKSMGFGDYSYYPTLNPILLTYNEMLLMGGSLGLILSIIPLTKINSRLG
ncbi:MAG: energy-coupling factor transporter transmembrane component T [Candidatus Altiarchaeota archaeon]|nr:energy-coupling factor transporter transmembrane component T [Candidatus Altiarchaeota archaeon]